MRDVAPVSQSRARLGAGRYRIERKIGTGGMSIIYRGMQLGTARHVAVKVLREELSTNPEIVARLQKVAASARADLGDSLTGVKGPNIRPAGDTRQKPN